MRASHVIAALVAVFILWASLFFTGLSQTNKQNRTLAGIQSVLNQDTTILNAQKNQPTTTELNTKLIALQAHVDCLFNLATQPNHSSAYIQAAEASCTIVSAPAKPSSASASVPQSPSKVFVSAPSPQSAPSTTKTPASNPPQPASTLDKLPLLGGLFKAAGL